MKVKGINKTQMVRDLLKAQPNLTAQQIADTVECSVTIVHEQRRNALKGKQMTARKQSRPAKKKMGRPSNASVEANEITQACNLLARLTKTIRELEINFFDDTETVSITWNDEVFNVKTTEVPQVINSIKYLITKHA